MLELDQLDEHGFNKTLSCLKLGGTGGQIDSLTNLLKENYGLLQLGFIFCLL